jgi:hypothetical protein
MRKNFINLIINLFDGGASAAAAAGNGGESGGAPTGAEKAADSISRETRQRGQELGLSDDLMSSYNEAFGKKSNNANAAAQQNTQTNEEGKNESDSTDSEFESLIKGKYKPEYDKRVQNLVSDRLKNRDSQIAQQQAQIDADNEIFKVLAVKYPNVDINDKKALLEAVRNDDSIFTQTAIEEGISATEARDLFDKQQEQNKDKAELEQLRREKAASQLDARLNTLAEQTKQMYPDFDLHSEFENPDFRAAMDFIAQRNTERNKQTGRNDEVFDITYAYEMAHADEIRNNTIKRASKAAISAVTQSIAANGLRPKENANEHSAPAKSKSVRDMNDSDFDALLNNIKSGKAKIPRG